MRYVLADPALRNRSAGEEFALNVAHRPAELEITSPLRVSLATTFPLAETRPRYTVRHLLKSGTVDDTELAHVFLSERPPANLAASGTRYAETPEAEFAVDLRKASLTDVTASIQVPNDIVYYPSLLATFVDHRLVVRLCTRENEVLLHGSDDGAVTGLLQLPDLRCRATEDDLATELRRAAVDVEEMGGSCDGIVAHPDTYWELVCSGMLNRLAETGVRVSRTRMIPRDRLLFGDFRAGATVLDSESSELRLTRQSEEGNMATLRARSRIGVALHLPQHFLLVRL